MIKVDLGGEMWTVRAADGPAPDALRGRDFPARVPGCVHVDLIRAGAIADPALGMNEPECWWVGECDWVYRREFQLDAAALAHDRVDLVFDGLDTIADILVNGRPVGSAANMFHPHRFDAKAALRPGTNQLEVRFASPLKHIRAEERRLGPRPVNGDWDPYVFIRKSACSFGWDWGPKAPSSGMWLPVRLETWSGARVESVSVAHPTEGIVQLTVWLEWSRTSGRPARLRASMHPAAGSEPNEHDVDPGQRLSVHRLFVTDPQRWCPRGHGEQPLYDLTVTLDGDVAWRSRFGFRHVRLLTDADPDGRGSRFAIEINGREVFCKGANWIPEGLWPSEVTDATLRRRVEQAAAANMNMLRVWGGGYYERDAFYDACDELGILVWQDFMFACAMYPEEEPYPRLVEAEARHQVRRLSPHPSVALWCGGNECTWAHDAWGVAEGRAWKDRLQGRTWGKTYYLKLLRAAVADGAFTSDPAGELYWPNSPWPGREDLPPNSADHGDRHTWDARGTAYRSIVPRFCSEFGAQSPAAIDTLRRSAGDAALVLGSKELEHRQRATGGTAAHIDAPLRERSGEPEGFAEWHARAQQLQAESLRIGIEWLRVNRPRCMGALIWQLNDAWAGLSWSLIDAAGVEKPAYRAVREAFAPRLLTIQPFEGQDWLWAVNDPADPWSADALLRLHRPDAPPLKRRVPFTAAPAAATRIARIADVLGPIAPGDHISVTPA